MPEKLNVFPTTPPLMVTPLRACSWAVKGRTESLPNFPSMVNVAVSWSLSASPNFQAGSRLNMSSFAFPPLGSSEILAIDPV